MVKSSALYVLFACALKTSALRPSRQAKNRLIGEALNGPAETESVAVVVPAVKVELGIEGRGVFQETSRLLIIADQAGRGQVRMRNER